VTSDRWDDLVALFGPTGQQGGCWCMWNRQSSREFEECKGEANQKALHRLVADGKVPGLLAYDRGLPVGWVSLGPREVFSRLRRSRVTKPVDDLPVWAITCFVISRKHRYRGVATRLLEAAIEYARTQGAVAVEGYPVEPRLARRSEHRPVMRLTL